jgi:hypothetical protein
MPLLNRPLTNDEWRLFTTMAVKPEYGGPSDRIWSAFIDSINDPPRLLVYYHGGKTTFVHPDNFYWDGKPDSPSDCVWMVPR